MTRRIAKKIALGCLQRRYSARAIRRACEKVGYTPLMIGFALTFATKGARP